MKNVCGFVNGFLACKVFTEMQFIVDAGCEELIKTTGAFGGGKPSIREPGPKYFQLHNLKAHRICLFL